MTASIVTFVVLFQNFHTSQGGGLTFGENKLVQRRLRQCNKEKVLIRQTQTIEIQIQDVTLAKLTAKMPMTIAVALPTSVSLISITKRIVSIARRIALRPR